MALANAPMSPDFNAAEFVAELDALRARARDEFEAEDAEHLLKIERWGRWCSRLGWASAWLPPNPVSALLIAQGRTTRWAMIAHHVLHRGYDRVPGVPERLTSRRFAAGRRRWLDWNDWIDPQAWAFEHNQQHHYRLGEDADPDLVELNADWLRDAAWPTWLKLAVVSFYATTWKVSYYAPNTLRQLRARRGKRAAERDELESFGEVLRSRDFLARCVGPYALVQFGLLPGLFLPLGPLAVGNAAANSLLAEVLTNLHCFAIITTNHAGDDLYAYEGKPRDRADFYLRQIMGSTNFRTGSDLNDFLHGWLNYQIEHHLFPDLPMRAYQRLQPEVKRICEKYGVPYVQESVWVRVRKTVEVMIGAKSMRTSGPLPA